MPFVADILAAATAPSRKRTNRAVILALICILQNTTVNLISYQSGECDSDDAMNDGSHIDECCESDYQKVAGLC